jgi:hypothetical protein
MVINDEIWSAEQSPVRVCVMLPTSGQTQRGGRFGRAWLSWFKSSHHTNLLDMCVDARTVSV